MKIFETVVSEKFSAKINGDCWWPLMQINEQWNMWPGLLDRTFECL